MAFARIICLAYSRRDGGRCLAGIDEISGQWIRPVSRVQGGALNPSRCLVRTKEGSFREPRPLDVLLIDLIRPCPKVAQPENWLISEVPWELVDVGDRDALRKHISSDPELFRGYERYVSSADIELHPPRNSLAIVSPENLTWYAGQTPYGKRRIEGNFSIGGANYTLPLTDEAYERNLCDLPLSRRRQHDPSAPVLLTLSLGDVWSETLRHYKLIAGVVP